MDVKFEYIVPRTPQQNHSIEHKFAMLYNGVQDILNGGKFSCFLRKSLWADAANTVMPMENNLITKPRKLSLFLNFWEEKEKCLVFITKIWRNVHHDFP